RHDRDLAAHQLVDQRRLPDVGASDDRYESRPELVRRLGHSACSEPRSGAGVTRTDTMRRPCTRSAQNTKPLTRAHSPSVGTCPSASKTSPPTVSHSPDGSSSPSSSLISSIGV